MDPKVLPVTWEVRMRKSPRKCRSQAAAEILSSKGRSVVVGVDFAKSSMKVQAFLDRETVAWKRGLDIENSRAGVEFLLERLSGILRKWRVGKDRVVFGGEDPASYALPFIEELRRRGFLFVAVNAKTASENRDNTRASSDLLDLDGIAEAVRRRLVRDIEASGGVYGELRRTCRARLQATKLELQVGNQIRRVADLVFPGLLDDGETGMQPLSSACLVLLDAGLTPARLAKMKDAAVLRLLSQGGAIRREEVLARLRALAARALPPPCGQDDLLARLRCKVAMLRAVRAEIACEERQMARSLAQTPCAWLLTLPGAGVVLVAHLVAELGDPAGWRSVAQAFSYAGCAQRHKQTGGPENEGYSLGLPRDCNSRLKLVLLQLAFHAGTTPHPVRRAAGLGGGHRLQRHYQKVEARGGKSLLSTARLLLRIAFKMVHDRTPYDPGAEEGVLSVEEEAAWMNATLEAAAAKIAKYDLAGIPDDASCVSAFRAFAKEYAENLSTRNL